MPDRDNQGQQGRSGQGQDPGKPGQKERRPGEDEKKPGDPKNTQGRGGSRTSSPPRDEHGQFESGQQRPKPGEPEENEEENP